MNSRLPKACGPAALVLALVPPLSSAQEGETPTQQALDKGAQDAQDTRDRDPLHTAEGRPEQGPVGLSLEEALSLAAGANLELKVAESLTETARFDALGSWGAFDWVFDASYGYSTGEFETGPDPTNPDLPEGLLIDSDQQDFSLALTKPVTTGGQFALSFDSSYGDSTTDAIGDLPPGIAGTFPREDDLFPTDTLALSYVQPLSRGAWSTYATSQQRLAELQHEIQVEAERDTRQSILLGAHDAYWTLVAARESLQVAEAGLELGKQQLDQNQRRLDAGVGTEVEVLQARAEVASRREALLRAQTDVYQAMDALKRQVYAGKDEALWNLDIEPTTPLPEASAEGIPTWSEAVSVAVENRPDLRRQRLEVDAARLRHDRASSERKALLDLVLSLSSRNVDEHKVDAIEDTLSFEYPQYRAEVFYSLPIGNRTRRYAERAAEVGIRTALLEYDRIEVGAIALVRAAVREVQYSVEAVRAAEESRELAQRQLEAEQARYAEGLSTNFEVLEFQQSLIEAMERLLRARVDYAKSLMVLRSAQGLLDVREAP